MGCLGVQLAGDALEDVDERGVRLADDTLLILMNARPAPVDFLLPGDRAQERWELILDTHRPTGRRSCPPLPGGKPLELPPRSLLLLRERVDS